MYNNRESTRVKEPPKEVYWALIGFQYKLPVMSAYVTM